MKKVFLIFMLAVLVLTSCTPKATISNKPFVFISPNKIHPVVRTMALGFWQACIALNVPCKDYSFDGVDFSKMAVSVDQVIAAGSPGAIAFVDKAVYAQDAKLIKAGIPVDAIHVQVAQGDVPGLLAWVAADAGDYARNVADFMGDKMGGKGTIALTQGDLNDVENLITAEFTKEMNTKYPNIKVLPPQMEGFDPTAAIAVASAILTAHPEITAAYGTTGGSPTTWATALQQAGRKPGDVIVAGMDYTLPNLDLVKSGWVTVLVAQPLYTETYKALEILVANSKGEKVDYANVMPAPLVTIDNVQTYYDLVNRIDQVIPTPVPTP